MKLACQDDLIEMLRTGYTSVAVGSLLSNLLIDTLEIKGLKVENQALQVYLEETYLQPHLVTIAQNLIAIGECPYYTEEVNITMENLALEEKEDKEEKPAKKKVKRTTFREQVPVIPTLEEFSVYSDTDKRNGRRKGCAYLTRTGKDNEDVELIVVKSLNYQGPSPVDPHVVNSPLGSILEDWRAFEKLKAAVKEVRYQSLRPKLLLEHHVQLSTLEDQKLDIEYHDHVMFEFNRETRRFDEVVSLSTDERQGLQIVPRFYKTAPFQPRVEMAALDISKEYAQLRLLVDLTLNLTKVDSNSEGTGGGLFAKNPSGRAMDEDRARFMSAMATIVRDIINVLKHIIRTCYGQEVTITLSHRTRMDVDTLNKIHQMGILEDTLIASETCKITGINPPSTTPQDGDEEENDI